MEILDLLPRSDLQYDLHVKLQWRIQGLMNLGTAQRKPIHMRIVCGVRLHHWR